MTTLDQLRQVVQDLQDRVVTLERERLEDAKLRLLMQNEIDGLKHNLAKQREDSKSYVSVDSLQKTLKTTYANATKNGTTSENTRINHTQLVNKAVDESRERNKREGNVVIFGLPESTKRDELEKQNDEQNQIGTLFAAIKADTRNIVKYFRLKASTRGGPAPIVVTVGSVVNRNILLKLAYSNRASIQNVYINPDLTQTERIYAKELRQQCKDKNTQLPTDAQTYFGTRNNKIKEIQKTTQ